jgi:murein DD-endopeptidase MepM/ murein hydrolase activator NlpD
LSFGHRRRTPRAWLLPSLAILALAAVGPVPALAGEPVTGHTLSPSALKPDPLPEPRVQLPGQTTGFRLPFAAGQDFRIEQGWNSTFSHNGKNAYAYDIHMELGTDVLAAAAGLVAFVHEGETACGGPELLKHANYVTIYHSDGSATLYAHLSTVGVKVGDIVAAGQVIGTSGNTGYSQCLPHLHFARQYQGKSVSQSVPIYFEGYAKQEFHTGDVVSVPQPPCTAPTGEADPGVQPGAGSAASDTGGAIRVAADRRAAGPRSADARPPVVAAPTASTRQADVDPADIGSYCGVYYGGALDQPVAFVRRDGMLNFDWGSKGPGGYWLDDPTFAFAARWTGDFVFPSAGTYTIGAMWSGAVVVSIDGIRVIDRWVDQGQPVEAVTEKVLGAGIHRVDVDYLAATGHGMLKVGWGRLLADE